MIQSYSMCVINRKYVSFCYRFCEDCEPRLPVGLSLEKLLDLSLNEVFLSRYFYFGFKTERLKKSESDSPILLSTILTIAKDKQYNFTGVRDQDTASEIHGMVAWQMQSVNEHSTPDKSLNVSQTMKKVVQNILDMPADASQNVSDISNNLSSFILSKSCISICNSSNTDSQADQTLLEENNESDCVSNSARRPHDMNCAMQCDLSTRNSEEGHAILPLGAHGLDTYPTVDNIDENSTNNSLKRSTLDIRSNNISDTVNHDASLSLINEMPITPNSNCVRLSERNFKTPNLTFVNITRGSFRENSYRKVDFSFELDSDSSQSPSQHSSHNIKLSQPSGSNGTGSANNSTLSSYSAHISQLFNHLLEKSSTSLCKYKLISKSAKSTLPTAKNTNAPGTVVDAETFSCVVPKEKDSQQCSEDLFGNSMDSTFGEEIAEAEAKFCAVGPSPVDVTLSGEVSMQKTLEKTEIYLEHYRNATAHYPTYSAINSIHSVLSTDTFVNYSMSQSLSDTNDCGSSLKTGVLLENVENETSRAPLETIPQVILDDNQYCDGDFVLDISTPERFKDDPLDGDTSLLKLAKVNYQLSQTKGGLMKAGRAELNKRPDSPVANTGNRDKSDLTTKCDSTVQEELEEPLSVAVEELPYSEKLSDFLDDMNGSNMYIDESDLDSGFSSVAKCATTEQSDQPNSEDLFGNSVDNIQCVIIDGDKRAVTDSCSYQPHPVNYKQLHVANFTFSQGQSQTNDSDSLLFQACVDSETSKALGSTLHKIQHSNIDSKPPGSIQCNEANSCTDSFLLNVSTPVGCTEDPLDGDTSLIKLAKLNYLLTKRNHEHANNSQNEVVTIQTTLDSEVSVEIEMNDSDMCIDESDLGNNSAGSESAANMPKICHSSQFRPDMSEQHKPLDIHPNSLACESSGINHVNGLVVKGSNNLSQYSSDLFGGSQSMFDFDEEGLSESDAENMGSPGTPSRNVKFHHKNQCETIPVIDSKMQTTPTPCNRRKPRRSCLRKSAIIRRATLQRRKASPLTTHRQRHNDTTDTACSEDLFCDRSPVRSPNSVSVLWSPEGRPMPLVHPRKSTPMSSLSTRKMRTNQTSPLSSIENAVSPADNLPLHTLDCSDIVAATPSPVTKCLRFFRNFNYIPKGVLVFGPKKEKSTADIDVGGSGRYTLPVHEYPTEAQRASQSMFSDESFSE